jgi:hypothetical protein
MQVGSATASAGDSFIAVARSVRFEVMARSPCLRR